MKKGIIVVLMLIYLGSVAQTKTVYTCPMHLQVQKSAPGKCPLCGMTLEKKTVKVVLRKTVPPKKELLKPPVDTIPKRDDTVKDTATKIDHGDHGNRKMDTMETGIIDQIQSKVNFQPGRTVRYDLYVKDTIVNFTGKMKRAIAVNGSIPAPTLVFTEGDTAEIYLHNQLNEETSLHWHGIILPNQADGVPFLTTKRIGPGETHLYKFKVVQNGTYWYHSHSALQEQSGMYGALIFKPGVEAGAELYNKEYTVVLSEWTDDNPMQVQRRLRTANDWFAIKKGSVQSYAEAIKAGHLKTKLTNEWKRIKAMDVSDVYYNKFLINGMQTASAPGFKAGDRIRLKIVNAGASSYFWLGYGGGKISVIGNDGNDMVPVEVDRLIVGPAETYDLVVTIPENMSYEFRSTSEDRTGYSSLWLGSGHQMPAPTLPRLRYFEGMKMMNDMMNINGTMNDMGMKMSNQVMDMNTVMYPEITGNEPNSDTSGLDHPGHNMNDMASMNKRSSDIVTLNYNMLRSPIKTRLPDGPVKTLHFMLTGNMNRYLWSLDNKTVKESDKIMINKGEVLKLIITNNSMMRHPMHLHGHDFRVVNTQGDYAPLKNVIDIMPMETDTIEFAANQSGNWFFHCHILFHMMAGMGRVFTYTNSPVNPELPDARKAYQMFRRHKDQSMKHLMIRAGIETNGSDGELMISSDRYALRQIWHLGYSDHHGYESETMLGRYFGVNQWWFGYVGFDYHYQMVEAEKTLLGQKSNKTNRKTFVIGVGYTLPWLVAFDARVDGNGRLRLQLSREDIPVTSRLRFNFMGNTDKEYMAGFRFIVSKWLSLSTHYDSDMGPGAGITLTY
jgi:CopA family copper-resistance protein